MNLLILILQFVQQMPVRWTIEKVKPDSAGIAETDSRTFVGSVWRKALAIR